MKIEHTIEKTVNHQQRLIFTALLCLSILVCSIYIVTNIEKQRYFFVYMELFVVVISAIFLWLFQRTTSYKRFYQLAASFLFIIFSLITFANTYPNSSVTIYAWLFLIPPLSYALLGKSGGFNITIFFTILTLVAYYYSIKAHGQLYEFESYNVVLCLLSNWFFIHLYETSQQRAKYKLSISSLHDSLTNLYNRRALSKITEQHKDSDCLTAIIIDIDFFKRINDNYGHEAGDTALIIFAEELSTYFDKIGYIIRMGGEEFCLLLPELTLTDAKRLGEDFLTIISNKEIHYKKDVFSITFSAGACQYPLECDNYSGLLKIADDRLYKAKLAGRKRIVVS